MDSEELTLADDIGWPPTSSNIVAICLVSLELQGEKQHGPAVTRWNMLCDGIKLCSQHIIKTMVQCNGC